MLCEAHFGIKLSNKGQNLTLGRVNLRFCSSLRLLYSSITMFLFLFLSYGDDDKTPVMQSFRVYQHVLNLSLQELHHENVVSLFDCQVNKERFSHIFVTFAKIYQYLQENRRDE